MRRKITAVLIALGLIGALVGLTTNASAGGSATMSVAPANQNRLTGQTFDVYVMVDTPNAIGAYEFSLDYDTMILQVESISNDTFLGSTGRPPTCFNLSNQNLITYGCSTGGTSPEGPIGSGRLARIVFRAVGAGTTSLTMRDASLADVNGEPLAVNDANGSVTVLQGPTPTKTSTPQPTATVVPANTPIPISTPVAAATATATVAPAPTATPPSATATPIVAAAATATPLPPSATNTPKPPAQRTATAQAATQTRTAGGGPPATSVPGGPSSAATGSSEPVTSAPQQGVLGAGRRPGIRLPDTGSGGSR